MAFYGEEANSDESFLEEFGAMELFDSDDERRLNSDSKTQQYVDDDYISSDEERTEEDKAMEIKYCTQLKESGGFDVDPDLRGDFIRSFFPYNPDPVEKREAYEKLCRFSELGVDKYNSDNGTKYKFVKFVKSVVQLVAGGNYYLTFEAVESLDSDPILFQALVYDGIPPKGQTELIEVEFVRKRSNAC